MTPMPLPAEAPEKLRRIVIEAAQQGVRFYIEDGTVKLGAHCPPPAELLGRLLAEGPALSGWFLAANDIAPDWPVPGPMVPPPEPPGVPARPHADRVRDAYAATPGAVVRATDDAGGTIELPDGRRLYLGPGAWRRWRR